MQYVASLLPIAIYLLAVYKIDNYALVSLRRMAILVVCGMLAALACFGLFRLTDGLLPDASHPVLEELLGAVPLFVLAWRKRIVFFIDSVICGAAVGGGFSILENIFYLVLGNEMGMGTVLFRGLEVALIHIGCSAVVAAALVLGVRVVERSRSPLEVKPADVVMTIALLVAAVVAHTGHNLLHFNPVMQFTAVLGVTGGLLACTYLYDVDMIHSWLDSGLDTQVNLLQSIREGRLDETNTGQFLMSVKKSFPPEVFFDVICYVQLHVELSVAAKSRFMLREAELELPLEDAQKETYLSQFSEFKILEQRLGKSATMTVAPVVKLAPADRKSIDDLLSECRH